jgi:signal transduction histidine kinase
MDNLDPTFKKKTACLNMRKLNYYEQQKQRPPRNQLLHLLLFQDAFFANMSHVLPTPMNAVIVSQASFWMIH